MFLWALAGVCLSTTVITCITLGHVAALPGPLLQIYGFHPGCIRWCTMHALNLGILFTVNGGGLKLVPSVPGWKC